MYVQIEDSYSAVSLLYASLSINNYTSRSRCITNRHLRVCVRSQFSLEVIGFGFIFQTFVMIYCTLILIFLILDDIQDQMNHKLFKVQKSEKNTYYPNEAIRNVSLPLANVR